MIILFSDYDQAAWDLHYSLIRDGYKSCPVVLHDDGFLPGDVISIWDWHLGLSKLAANPLHINDLKLPLDYEIEQVDGEFLIKSIEGTVGRVTLHGDRANRLVHTVEWMFDNSFVFQREWYNRYGFKFKVDTFIKGMGLVSTEYLNISGHVIASVSHTVGCVSLGSKVFKSLTDFYTNTIKNFPWKRSLGIIYDNLGDSLQVVMGLVGTYTGKNYLVFSENYNGVLPENINYIKEHKELNTTIVLTSKENRETLKDKDSYLFYSLKVPVVDSYGSSTDALITTDTDDIKDLDYLVDSCPNTTFHIASNTLMSDKLMAYTEKETVKLYPAISQAKLEWLFSKCGVFLDIANSGTVFDVNRKAVERNMLRMGYWGISSKQYIPKESMFRFGTNGISNVLNYVYNNPQELKNLVKSQNLLLGINLGSDFKDIESSL